MFKAKDLDKETKLKKLRKLKKTLNYSPFSLLLIGTMPFVSAAIVPIALLLYAIYLVKALYELQKYKYIILLAGMTLPFYFVSVFVKGIIIKEVFYFIPMLMLLLFCWIVNYNIVDWIEEIETEDMNFDE